jgi:DNA replication and repair protein RecF
MQLLNLSLTHFRNYNAKKFIFNKPTTIIVGPNAVGKTSVIEAIYLLATGDSFRASKIEQMIAFNQPFGRVVGNVRVKDFQALPANQAPSASSTSASNTTNSPANQAPSTSSTTKLEVLLTRGEVAGRKTRKRIYSVNGVKRIKRNFIANLLAVVFRPEDMRLIEGSPKRRREFLDRPLVMTDREYARSLNTYQNALIKRNKLLTLIKVGEMPKSALTFWSMTILKHGQVIQARRQQFLNFFKAVSFGVPFSIKYNLSAITAERLKKYANQEIAAGYTLIGPHKDDFSVELAVTTEQRGEEKRNIAFYGSRGQQRMGVLWLKTCELEYLTHATHQRPVLLLDDILSELDQKHRKLVFTLINGNQTIITTANHELIKEIKAELVDVVVIKI